jgi:SH3-like domain-containing protein
MNALIFVNGPFRLFMASFIGVLVVTTPLPSHAESGLQVPRFVSLKQDRVFVRAGPGDQYPINWVYLREGFPVEVVDEFDNWRLVRDIDNVEGWIHSVMLSGRRFAIVVERHGDNGKAQLHRKPEASSPAIAELEAGAYGQLLDCTATWCRMQFMPYRGWVKRNHIWGIYPQETLRR